MAVRHTVRGLCVHVEEVGQQPDEHLDVDGAEPPVPERVVAHQAQAVVPRPAQHREGPLVENRIQFPLVCPYMLDLAEDVISDVARRQAVGGVPGSPQAGEGPAVDDGGSLADFDHRVEGEQVGHVPR